MPTVVNTHEAKTHLSQLLARVERGEEIVIARAGRPVAKLVPAAPPPRRFGTMDGQVQFLPGWDDPFTVEELLGEDPLVDPLA